ncbi:hypothetical protein R3W88_028750 [Solanum pinnatisectum]|uniref:Uncharacterized protein n=1 Tax=Solanum pinnatisectum TaxID=50273 RepID=A0AAV9K5I5_9SOLN|nr:hypothetical protein R3W88_028750 [Solanum pinnatisectum]
MGKAPEGTISSQSPTDTSPLTADGFGTGTPCPALRVNPFPKVTDPFFQLSLPTLFHRP